MASSRVKYAASGQLKSQARCCMIQLWDWYKIGNTFGVAWELMAACRWHGQSWVSTYVVQIVYATELWCDWDSLWQGGVMIKISQITCGLMLKWIVFSSDDVSHVSLAPLPMSRFQVSLQSKFKDIICSHQFFHAKQAALEDRTGPLNSYAK